MIDNSFFKNKRKSGKKKAQMKTIFVPLRREVNQRKLQEY